MIPRRDVFGRIPSQSPGPITNEMYKDQTWTPGPIGLNDYASKLYAKAGSTRKKSNRSSRRKKTKTLNVVTTFPNPWKGKLSEEIEAIKNRRSLHSKVQLALDPHSFQSALMAIARFRWKCYS